MPDIRLRPATGVPSDVALGPSVDSRVDIVLRPIPGSDVSLTANVQPAAAQTEAPAESYTLSAVLQQAAASVAGTLTARLVITGSVTQAAATVSGTLSVPTTFCDYDYAADTYDNASDTYDCGAATTPARRNDSDGPGFEDDDIELIVVALRRRLRF